MKSFSLWLKCRLSPRECTPCGLSCTATPKLYLSVHLQESYLTRRPSTPSVKDTLKAPLQWPGPDLSFCPQSITFPSTHWLILTVGCSSLNLPPLQSCNLLLTTSSCSPAIDFHYLFHWRTACTGSARRSAPGATGRPPLRVSRLFVLLLSFLKTSWSCSCHAPLQLYLALTAVHPFPPVGAACGQPTCMNWLIAAVPLQLIQTEELSPLFTSSLHAAAFQQWWTSAPK